MSPQPKKKTPDVNPLIGYCTGEFYTSPVLPRNPYRSASSLSSRADEEVHRREIWIPEELFCLECYFQPRSAQPQWMGDQEKKRPLLFPIWAKRNSSGSWFKVWHRGTSGGVTKFWRGSYIWCVSNEQIYISNAHFKGASLKRPSSCCYTHCVCKGLVYMRVCVFHCSSVSSNNSGVWFLFLHAITHPHWLIQYEDR